MIVKRVPNRTYSPVAPGVYHGKGFITSTQDTRPIYQEDLKTRSYVPNDYKPQRTIEINNSEPRNKIMGQVKRALRREQIKKDDFVAVSEAYGGTNSSIICSGISGLKEKKRPNDTLHSIQFKLKGDNPERDISIARDIIGEIARQANKCADLFGEICFASWHKGGKADEVNDAKEWKAKPGYWAHVNRPIVDETNYGKIHPYNFGKATQKRFDKHRLHMYSSVTNGPDGALHLAAKNRDGLARRFHYNIQNDGTYGVQSFRDSHNIPADQAVANIIYGSGYNINIGQKNLIVNTENGHITRETCPALKDDWDKYGQYLEPQRVGRHKEFGDLERHEIIVAGGNTTNMYSGPKLAANNVIDSIKQDLDRDGQTSENTAKMLGLLNIGLKDAIASDLFDIKQQRSIDNPDLDRSILANYSDGTVSQKGLLALRIYENLAHRAGTMLAKFFDDSQVKEGVDFRKATKIGITGSQGKGMYDRQMPPSILSNFVTALNIVRTGNPLTNDDVIIHAPIQDGAFAAALARLGIRMGTPPATTSEPPKTQAPRTAAIIKA